MYLDQTPTEASRGNGSPGAVQTLILQLNGGRTHHSGCARRTLTGNGETVGGGLAAVPGLVLDGGLRTPRRLPAAHQTRRGRRASHATTGRAAAAAGGRGVARLVRAVHQRQELALDGVDATHGCRRRWRRGWKQESLHSESAREWTRGTFIYTRAQTSSRGQMTSSFRVSTPLSLYSVMGVLLSCYSTDLTAPSFWIPTIGEILFRYCLAKTFTDITDAMRLSAVKHFDVEVGPDALATSLRYGQCISCFCPSVYIKTSKFHNM